MIFYFDESFHTRKITLNNINTDEINENYVACYIGSNNWESIEKDLINLESKYKPKFSITETGELKSTTLLNKNKFDAGIMSLKNEKFDFYNELFNIIDGKVSICFNIYNKVEVLLKEILPSSEYFERNHLSYNSFLYFFTKFIVKHPEYKILNILCSRKNNKIKTINKILENHLIKIKSIKKKERERAAIIETLQIFKLKDFELHIKPFKEINWIYQDNALLFNSYCKEREFDKVELIIDNEEKTYKAFKDTFNSKQIDSKDSVYLRLCDWIAGFIADSILNYERPYNNSDDEFTPAKVLLPEKFFKHQYQQEKYNLFIQKVYNIFIAQQQYYWTISTGIYNDETVNFIEFIKYYNYCLDNNEMPNSIDFNNWLCEILEEHINNL